MTLAPPVLGLSTYRWNNNIKSVLLTASFPFILLAVVWFFFYLVARDNVTIHGTVSSNLVGVFLGTSPNLFPAAFAVEACKAYAPLIFAFALFWLAIGSLFNDGLIRLASRGVAVRREEQPDLYNLLENLCISRGMKMPALYEVDTPVKNSFASGMGAQSFSITVTRGLVDSLEKDELEAVLAHELSHIINRDVRLLVVATLFCGMLSFFAEIAWKGFFFGGSRRGGILLGPLLLVAFGVFVVGYVASFFFRLALSRRREFLADAGAVELTKRPESLIRALQKIEGQSDLPYLPGGVQAMLIDSSPSFLNLFDTHPLIESRIAVLRRLGGQIAEHASIIPESV